VTKHCALVALLVLLAFACGVLAVGWRAEHRRVSCYQDMADEGLVAGSDCRR
jgi:hypothetical protein